MDISMWLILAIIGGIALYFYTLWLFLKAVIKTAVKEALKENQIENLHGSN